MLLSGKIVALLLTNWGYAEGVGQKEKKAHTVSGGMTEPTQLYGHMGFFTFRWMTKRWLYRMGAGKFQVASIVLLVSHL